MPSSSIQLRLNAHSPTYVPGEDISGRIVLNATKALKVQDVKVALIGVCSSYVNAGSEDDCDNRRSQDKNEIVEFVRISTTCAAENSYAPGEYEIPFTIKIPLTSQNERGQLRADWSTTPLPSTFDGVSDNGSIKYVLQASFCEPGIFSFSTKTSHDIRIASLASCNPSIDLLRKRKFVEQKVDVKIYEYPDESVLQWAKRVIGVDTSTDTRPLVVRMTHSAAGLPAWNHPFTDFVSLQVVKPESDDDKKGIEYVVTEINARIRYTIIATAYNRTHEYTLPVQLAKLKSLPADPLQFNADSRGRLVCDITHYLQNQISTSEPALKLHSEEATAEQTKAPETEHHAPALVVHTPFVTERVPNLSINATLEVEVGIAPTVGFPIKPMFAKLQSVVSFYNSPTNQIPTAAEVHDDQELPPYREF